jgi:hypothetical protein
MTIDETLVQLDAQLHDNQIRVRRAAVQKAAELLQMGQCQQPCRERIIALLQTVVQNEAYTTVREAAQAVLSNLQEGVAPGLLPDDRQHMFGVSCRNSHVTYYDKRRVCSEKNYFIRSLVQAGGQPADELQLPCGQCDEVTKVWVDCEPYR